MKTVVLFFASLFVAGFASAQQTSKNLMASGPYDVVAPTFIGDPASSDRIVGEIYYDTQAGSFKGINSTGGFSVFSVPAGNPVVSTGANRLEWANVASCGSSPCTVTSSSGGLIASNPVTRTSAGTYVVNFAVAFSATPSCVVSGGNGGPGVYLAIPSSNSVVGVYTYNLGGSLSDNAFNIHCAGAQ